jgi:tryptophan synthase alpha subunit
MIARTFSRLRAAKQPGLVAYVTAGDDARATAEILRAGQTAPRRRSAAFGRDAAVIVA